MLLETDSVQLTYKFEHYYTILQLSVIIQLNNLSRGEFPVISVRRRADGKRFALKMMLADKCAAMEAEMMRGLDHYNILQLETDFVKDNNHYLVLERCQQNMTEFKGDLFECLRPFNIHFTF